MREVASKLFKLSALLWALGLVHAAPAAETAQPEIRVALVIGNGAYKEAPLLNPVNDATDIAKALEGFGFKVILKRNVTTRDMRQAIRDFGTELRRANVGLFYFAGHGIQIKGNNYLVPVGADIQNEADAEDLSIDVGYLTRTMEDSQVKVSLVILDACRNNPFARSFRSVSRGLGQMTAATGSLIAFATAPGSVAADGAGRNGIYTKHLLESLRQQDTDALKVFQRVRAAVVRETGGKQTPWESTSLIGDFYFRPLPASASMASTEFVDWERLKAELAPVISNAPKPYSAVRLDATRSGMPRSYASAADKLKDTIESERQKSLVALYKRDAEAGDPVAQYSLGVIYRSGLGGRQDHGEAARWFQKAADAGDAAAQYAMAVAYARGEGVAKDDAESLRWSRKAADQGDAFAQNHLGIAYMTGRGVTKDEIEGAKWYRKAAEQGLHVAQDNLGASYVNGNGVSKDPAEGVKWVRLAADQGYAIAENRLGTMYAKGQGVAKDEAEAAKWYRKAADRGNSFAQSNLGWFYLNGIGGVPKDLSEAARLTRLAAEQKNAQAQTNLGYLYERGEGVPKDEGEAVAWYRKAADQGDATAQANLGLCYLVGRGVQKDQAEAIKWFKLAAKQNNARAKERLKQLGVDE